MDLLSVSIDLPFGDIFINIVNTYVIFCVAVVLLSIRFLSPHPVVYHKGFYLGHTWMV